MLLAPNQAPIAGAYIGVPGGPYRDEKIYCKTLRNGNMLALYAN